MNKKARDKIQAKIKHLITSSDLKEAFDESHKLLLTHNDRATLVNLEERYNRVKSEIANKPSANSENSLELNRITTALFEVSNKALFDEKKLLLKVLLLIFLVSGLIGSWIFYTKNGKSATNKNDIQINDCGFPVAFKDDSLFILITRFEDYITKNDVEPFGRALEMRIDAKDMRIKPRYRSDISPKTKEDAIRIQKEYNADLVIWGNIKNLSQNCSVGDICIKSQPSDSIQAICSGYVNARKFNMEYEKSVSLETIEQGELHIGSNNFDNWLIAIFNAKVAKKEPDLFIVDESLPKAEKVKLWEEQYRIFTSMTNYKNAKKCIEKAIQFEQDTINSIPLLCKIAQMDILTHDTQSLHKTYNRIRQINFHSEEFITVVDSMKNDVDRVDSFHLLEIDSLYFRYFTKKPEMLSVLYYDRGAAYFHHYLFHKAISNLDTSISLNSYNYESYELRGKAYNVLGEKEKAEQDLRMANKLNSKFYKFLNLRLLVLKRYWIGTLIVLIWIIIILFRAIKRRKTPKVSIGKNTPSV
jgi:tetratricopeptide (TPR) repeat protein